MLIDINGDGLDDWLYSDGTKIYALLNTGPAGSRRRTQWTIATSTLYQSPDEAPTPTTIAASAFLISTATVCPISSAPTRIRCPSATKNAAGARKRRDHHRLPQHRQRLGDKHRLYTQPHHEGDSS